MALNRIASYVRSLVGIKGKDGTGIATPANAFPVQVDGKDGATVATPANALPVQVNGKDTTTVATDANPVPTEVPTAFPVPIRGKDGLTIAGDGNAVPVAPIVGQAGVAANAGATDAKTQRIVSATDDPVVTNLGTDGAAPPSIPGTGVRGWLRSIYDTLFGLAKAEDAAAVDGEKGIVALAYRNDAEAALTSTDGDRSGVGVDRAGRIIVKRTAAVSNIRNGSRTSNGNLITLVAGETWVGQCFACLSAKANPGTAGGDFQVKISWSPGGSGGTPAFDVTVAQASISQVLLTSLIGENGNAQSPVTNVIVAAGTSGGTLDVQITGSPAQAFAGAVGSVEAKT